MKERILRLLPLTLVFILILGIVPLTGITSYGDDRKTVINTKGVSGQDIVAEARKWANKGAVYWSHYDPWLPSIYWRTGYTYEGQTSFDCSGFVSRVMNDAGFRGNYSPYGSCILSENYGNNYIAISIEELVKYGTDITKEVRAARQGDYSGLLPGDIIGWVNNGRHIIIYAGLNSQGKPTMVEFTGYGYLDRVITPEYQAIFEFGARYATPHIKKTYPTNGSITVKSNGVNINELPSDGSNGEAVKTIAVASKDSVYQAIGLVENTEGELWYKIKVGSSGKTGFIFAENAGGFKYIADAVFEKDLIPEYIPKGEAPALEGSITSEHSQFESLKAYILKDGKIIAETNSFKANYGGYELLDSKLYKDLKFDSLELGSYTLELRTTSVYYVATSGKAYTTEAHQASYYKQFTVREHSFTSTVVSPTCTKPGYTKKTCNLCGRTYTEDYIKAAGHSFGQWELVSKPTEKSYGLEIRRCHCNHIERRYVDKLKPMSESSLQETQESSAVSAPSEENSDNSHIPIIIATAAVLSLISAAILIVKKKIKKM